MSEVGLYGCHNKARHTWYKVPVRSLERFRGDMFELKAMVVQDTSTKECQYRKGTPNDPRCKGCVK